MDSVILQKIQRCLESQNSLCHDIDELKFQIAAHENTSMSSSFRLTLNSLYVRLTTTEQQIAQFLQDHPTEYLIAKLKGLAE